MLSGFLRKHFEPCRSHAFARSARKQRTRFQDFARLAGFFVLMVPRKAMTSCRGGRSTELFPPTGRPGIGFLNPAHGLRPDSSKRVSARALFSCGSLTGTEVFQKTF